MIQRDLTPYLLDAAQKYPVVTLTGPRQSGKTTLCKQVFSTYNYVNLEELAVRRFANEDPRGFFESYPPPIIIDEIQNCPDLVSQIQVESDARQKEGLFIITGSQQIALVAAINQSLAGRTALLNLLPLSQAEILQAKIIQTRDQSLFYGGLPRIYDKNIHPAQYYRDYVQTYIEKDVRSLLNIKNLDKFEIFIQLLAGRIGQLINLSSVSGEVGVSSTTLAEWLNVMEASHIIYKLKPWFTNIGKRLTKTPKLYFTDTGLLCSLLGITKEEHLLSHPLRGNIFENFVILEFLKKGFNAGEPKSLYFFRTEAGVEVDLLEQKGQSLYPWEIKMASSVHDDFFKSLNSFVSFFEKSPYEIVKGGIIYSGQNVKNYKGWSCLNYENLSKELNKI